MNSNRLLTSTSSDLIYDIATHTCIEKGYPDPLQLIYPTTLIDRTGIYFYDRSLSHGFYAMYAFFDTESSITMTDSVATHYPFKWAINNYQTYFDHILNGDYGCSFTAVHRSQQLPRSTWIDHPSSTGITFDMIDSIESNPLVDRDQYTQAYDERIIKITEIANIPRGYHCEYAVFEIDGNCLSGYPHPEGFPQPTIVLIKLDHTKFYPYEYS